MRGLTRGLAAGVLIAATAGSVAAQTQENAPKQTAASPERVIGEWSLKIAAEGRTFEPTLTLEADAQGKLKGIYRDSSVKETPTDTVGWDGARLTFTLTITLQGNEVDLAFQGQVADDRFEGDVEYTTEEASGVAEVVGTRKAPAAPRERVVGTWELELAAEGQVFKPTVEIKVGDDGKLAGTYRSIGVEDTAIKTIEWDGVTLTLKLAVAIRGTDVALVYKGEVSDDRIAGEVEYEAGPAFGVVDFKGIRRKVKETPNGSASDAGRP